MIISTWVLIFAIGGSGPSYPNHTNMIGDMPTVEECRRVAKEINDRFFVKQALCVEVKKVKS